ncbi:hypothetical protein PuT2_13195 [Pusillimonas sp. T2]|uniref:sigma factor n=1 Tax=Pusillimonas sp. T2 TaxID=1548123 RepID=UPI000B9D1800|nr:sigma factor [Pusillimonas sp. T2]OXR48384.1 hypothetical protein PuT2_13195 [Pusillimonas sp. T2]
MAVSHFNYNHTLIQCGQGNAQALSSLYQQEAAVMLALADQVLEDHGKAQQALHDVCVMVWKHADQFDPSAGSARAWIYSILRYRLMRELRHNPVPIDTARINQLHTWLDDNTRLMHEDLHDGLERVEPLAADALGLAYYKGLHTAQITRVLEQPEHEIRQLLNQALQYLEKKTAYGGPLPQAQRLAIAQYTLGTLQDHEEQNARELISKNDDAVQQALHWETVLLALADRLTPVIPDPVIYGRVQKTLGLPRIDPDIQPLARPETPAPAASAATASAASTPGASAAKTGAFATTASPKGASHTITSANTAPASSRGNAPAQTPNLSSDANTSHAPANASAASSAAASNAVAGTLKTTGPGAGIQRSARNKPRSKPAILLATLLIGAALGYVSASTGIFMTASTPEPTVPAAPPQPETLFIAILQPPGSTSTPGWVVTRPASHTLKLESLISSDNEAGKGLALWTRAPAQAEATFLGWLNDGTKNNVTLPANTMLTNNQLFEITLEDTSRSSNAQPDGTVLFIGQAVITTLPGPDLAPAAPQAQPG